MSIPPADVSPLIPGKKAETHRPGPLHLASQSTFIAPASHLHTCPPRRCPARLRVHSCPGTGQRQSGSFWGRRVRAAVGIWGLRVAGEKKQREQKGQMRRLGGASDRTPGTVNPVNATASPVPCTLPDLKRKSSVSNGFLGVKTKNPQSRNL